MATIDDHINWHRRLKAELVTPAQRTQPSGSTVDQFMDSYVRWREECERVQTAYRGWGNAVRADRDSAFAAYHEALDREERAAEAHARCVALVQAQAA